MADSNDGEMADSNDGKMADLDGDSPVTRINQLIFEANQKGGVAFGEYVVKMFVCDEPMDDWGLCPVRLWFPKGIYDQAGGDLIETVENTEAVERFLVSMRQVGTLTLVGTTKDYVEYQYHHQRVFIYNSVEFPAVLLDVFRVMARFQWHDFQYSNPDLHHNPYMIRSLLGAITAEQYDQEQIDRIRYARKIIKMEATMEPDFIPTIDPTHIHTIDSTHIPTIDPTHIPTIDSTHIPTLIEMTGAGWQIKCPVGQIILPYRVFNLPYRVFNLPNSVAFNQLLIADTNREILIEILQQSQKTQSRGSQTVPIMEEQPLIYHYRMAMELYQHMPADARAVILELLQGRYGKF